MFALPSRSVRTVARHWNGVLAPYKAHRNDEHREALVVEALRVAGLVLENDLTHSAYWSSAPLSRRVAVLLFLVDRGVVRRTPRDGRVAYEPTPDAELWVASHPSLAQYLTPTLELISALRNDLARKLRAERPADQG